MQNLSKNTKPTIFRITGSISNFFEYYYYRSYLYFIKKKTVAPEMTAISVIAISIIFYGIGISVFCGFPLPKNETAGIIGVALILIINYYFDDSKKKQIYEKYSNRTDVDENEKNGTVGCLEHSFFYHMFLLELRCWLIGNI